MDRLDRLERIGGLPVELDFLRALGFDIGLDWNENVFIEGPKSIRVDEIIDLLLRFERGVKAQLEFEGKEARRICVGGPKNGQPYRHGWHGCGPLLYHLGRARWAVYRVKDYRDGRAWYLGEATSKPKAKALYRRKVSESQKGDQ